MNDILHLWLRGEHQGELEQLRNGAVRLRYDADIFDRYGEGARPLSLSLPLERARVEGPALDAFLEGLLPEGQVRADLDREYQARSAFDLLAHIGVECAGAVQFTRDPEPPGTGHLIPLTGAEVDALVVALPTLTPPDNEPLTASLGGIQAKVLLTRDDGRWAWPTDGAMSTHIVKPQPLSTGGPQHLVHAEHWAMTVAARAGLPAARTELHDFDGRAAIVVERFDRSADGRTHQEDFAQALGLAPSSKYESTLRDQSRLRSIAELGSQNALRPRDFLVELLEQVTFNATIGNGDAHSKNYSLAIGADANYSLTPLYDVAPVFFLGQYRHAGHAIAGQVDLRYITREHLVLEGQSWGMSPARAASVVDDVIDRTAAAISEVGATEEIEALPEQVLGRVRTFAGTRPRPRAVGCAQ
ncbi:HipA domain-containing protein [Homoserinibacter sp. GY 40078]|uniref:HipA domain-containing protein n=1 Tax=Homoserinibacter sp. GY 40078 TaxID=2603275 RepID=UPI0011CB3739|nr:HipA domain-containing protein [Homoserinibacter sp. GY 40078]TXK18879.1 type II toxin-antitoxin system HipA family toxin [Homoserinibacter sp. GY 40078]